MATDKHAMRKHAIIGYGVVGKAMKVLLPEAVVYDPAYDLQDRDAVNRCDFAFVCVPTPANADGSCDISAVEQTIAWLETPIIVIRSTVPPGTTESLRARYNKRIVFQPEYLGETPAHPYGDVQRREFVVLGGRRHDIAEVAEAYSHVYHASVRFHFSDAITAELAKYMENCFFAAKVVFCNEFMHIAQCLGVEYQELREVWLADGRISRDHTFAYADAPGFGGKCLPKDLSAIICRAQAAGYAPAFLKAVEQVNNAWRHEMPSSDGR